MSNEDATKKRGHFERAYETGLFVERFRKLETDEMLTYGELSVMVGYNVQTKRSHLDSARRIILAEENVLIETIHGVGLRRSGNTGALGAGTRSRERICRESRRGLRRLGCADIAVMDNAQRLQFNGTAGVLGVLQECAKPKTARQLEGRVKAAGERLPVQKILAELSNGSGSAK